MRAVIAVIALTISALAACGRLGFDAVAGDAPSEADALGSDGPLPTGRWAHIALAPDDAFAIATDGALLSWGNDYLATLGRDAAPKLLDEVPGAIAGSWQLAAGGVDHACGIRADDTLWCWGQNDAGQLGRAASAAGALPTQVGTPLQPWASVAAGDRFTCAIAAVDRSLWCWGTGDDGRIGVTVAGDVTVPFEVDANAWLEVSTGEASACAIRATPDHELWCWGNNSHGLVGDGTTEAHPGVYLVSARAFAHVAVGPTHACALTDAGAVYCWGSNAHRALGLPADAFVPTLVPGAPPLSAIAVGDEHTCGLAAAGGALWCWGGTQFGQLLATGGDADVATPTEIAVPAAGAPTAVAIGGATTCILDDAARVFCWGDAGTGQIGNRAGEAHGLARADGFTDWTSVSMRGQTGCGTRGASGDVWCWGANASEAIGDGTQRARQAPASVATGFARVVAEEFTTYAIASTDGSVWLWGANVLGGGAFGAPTDPGYGPTLDVAGGANHACGIQPSNLMFCAGANDRGQLGDGTTTSSTTVVTPGGSWNAVAAGGNTTCGISNTDGRVFCWGDNASGQLGYGDVAIDANDIPGAIASTLAFGAIAIATYGDSACALVGGTGAAWCWGAGYAGQLGDGTFATTARTPVAVAGGLAFDELAVGDFHACGIASGALYCWGHADEGQLGNTATFADVATPARVGTRTDWRSVACGVHATCAVATDGTRWCTGANATGELGNSESWIAAPVVVP